MVAQFSQSLAPERKQALIAALQNLPYEWALTPVNGNKQPYRKNWQRKGMACQQLIEEIRSDRAKGFGLLTGVLSGGILAIDADGEAAHELLAMFGELPPTVAFTSGRPGRCQYLLRVGEEFWSVAKTTKLNSGIKGDDGKEQLLELRWDGCQSVLPPSIHPLTGQYQWVVSPDESEIADCPMWVIELILNGEKEQDQPTLQPQPQHRTRYEDITVPVPASIPLEDCLAKESRNLLNGVSEGGRNDAGAKLARDLIGCANYLQSIGQAFDGDPWVLFQDFASRCSPPIPARETSTIWKSAEKSRPTPACKGEGVDNCIKGWYWNNHVKGEKPSGRAIAATNLVSFPKGGGNGGDGGGNEPPYDEWLRAEVQSLIEQGVTGSRLTAAIAKLAKGSSPQVVWRIYYEIAEEIDREDSRDETLADLDNFLKAKGARLDIAKVLPASLASPIKLLAKQLGLRPECYLSVLLNVVSTLHRNNTWVRLWEATDFEVTPNLFTAIVADASQYKSPILKAIATKPLANLQKQAKQEHEENLRQYEADMEVWEASKAGDRPIKPARKIYYFTDSTSEGIVRQFSDRPESGLLNLVDELAGKFKSANQYRGGRGSDEEDLLSLYDGTGKVTLRATGIKSDLEDGLNFGLLGSIQPKVLQKFLRDCEDSNGNWARFVFVNQPLAMAEWQHDSGKIDLTALLVELYSKISRLPARTYTLSPEAKEEFRLARNRAEKLRVSDLRAGMRAYWGKVPGRIGKLAANLHVIHQLITGTTVSDVIPVVRVKEAIALCDFYAEQILSLYAEFEDTAALTPQLAKVIELASAKPEGVITLRDISRSTNWKSAQTKTVCNELVAMDRGSLEKHGKSLWFRVKKESSVTVSGIVSCSLTVEPHTEQAIQGIVSIVSNCQSNPENFSATDPPPEMAVSPFAVESDRNSATNRQSLTAPTIPQKACPVSDATVSEPLTVPPATTDNSDRQLKTGDRVEAISDPEEGIGIVECLDSGRYGVNFLQGDRQRYGLYDAEDLRLAPPRLPTLGIVIPPCPRDEGNPKARRLKR
jgi:hypothetical protein